MKSYFIDTNYILRFLLKENDEQYSVVVTLIKEAIDNNVRLYSSAIVFFELKWVLMNFYEKSKEETTQYLENILALDIIQFENQDLLIQSVVLFKKTSIDLEDCYNIVFYKTHHIDKFATFDKKLLKTL